ncbi:MAG TPA: RAMP superfamily CRISPR-associated protein, partial [Chloroflexaceae bacterium]|nr:RAMP superfamily CRISPR-associated protein [Chloroflexaceae bacterium]
MDTWTSRQIVRRLVVTGDLTLTSPAHLGSGEPAGVTDLTLLRDAVEGRPLLPGTSLAGALRGYLLARAAGYGETERGAIERQAERAKADAASQIAALLGGQKGDDDGAQSPLIVEDALATPGPAEVRDGVKIDPSRRTALDAGKYDLELLPAGTSFPLRFELLLGPDEDENRARLALLAQALGALEQGEIRIGARRSRGYGACRVAGWRAVSYDLTTPDGLLAWLGADHGWMAAPAGATREGLAESVLDVKAPARDTRHRFTVELSCAIDGALLIRSEEALTSTGDQPDFIHLRDLAGRPILPGTSLAGALRSRAHRIVEAVRPGKGQAMVDALFGRDLHAGRGDPTMSRLVVGEAAIAGGRTLVQSRVSIDRFTGGALDTALFSEAPQFGGDVTLSLELRAPKQGEIGLLLLLLKDLWTGDLMIGGEGSVGRGRLRGRSATLTLQTPDGPSKLWTIDEAEQGLAIDGDATALERFVAELVAMEVGDGAT